MRKIKYKGYIDNPIHGKGIFPVKSINFFPLVVELDLPDEVVCFFEGEVKLMQYIGLNDATKTEDFPDGMEIYEDDIVFDPVYNQYYIIDFDDNYAMFFLKNADEKNMDKPDYDFAQHDDEVSVDLYVVGNVHENKYLLQRGN